MLNTQTGKYNVLKTRGISTAVLGSHQGLGCRGEALSGGARSRAVRMQGQVFGCPCWAPGLEEASTASHLGPSYFLWIDDGRSIGGP